MTGSSTPRYQLVLTEDQMAALTCVCVDFAHVTSLGRDLYGREMEEISNMLETGDYVTLDEE